MLTEAGHDARAIPGETGQFDIVLNGELVFSKRSAGRFPEEDEVVAALAR